MKSEKLKINNEKSITIMAFGLFTFHFSLLTFNLNLCR